MASPDVIRLGVSACLLGERVRWDGDHRRDDFVAGRLARVLTLVPFCPEVELGLGVPRPPIDLVDRDRSIRLEGAGADHTEAMRALGSRRVAELEALGIRGYVCKSRSPSCGLLDVPVIHDGVRRDAGGRGLFAAVVAAALPVPLEDERRLASPRIRESFVTRVFANARLAALLEDDWDHRGLAAHHAREEALVLAHDAAMARSLEELLAGGATLSPARLASEYRRRLMTALGTPPTTEGHARALRWMAGVLEGAAWARVDRAIEAFVAGDAPVSEPRRQILEAARRLCREELVSQSYLDPDPRELALKD